jgi:hypothetical protein
MEQACKVRLAICSAGFRCKVHFMRVSKHGLRPRKCPSFSCHRLWTIFRGPIFRQSWQSNICSTVPIFTASLALSQNSLKNIPGIWLDWYSFIGKVLGHPFCSQCFWVFSNTLQPGPTAHQWPGALAVADAQPGLQDTCPTRSDHGFTQCSIYGGFMGF